MSVPPLTCRRREQGAHPGQAQRCAQEGTVGLHAAAESPATPPDAHLLPGALAALGWVWEDAGSLGITRFLGRNMAPIPAPPLSQGNQKWGPAARHSSQSRGQVGGKGSLSDFGCWQPGVGARCLFKGGLPSPTVGGQELSPTEEGGCGHS